MGMLARLLRWVGLMGDEPLRIGVVPGWELVVRKRAEFLVGFLETVELVPLQ